MLCTLHLTALQRTAAAVANEKNAASERDDKAREAEEARQKIKLLETCCAVKDETIRQAQAQIQLFEVSQNALAQTRTTSRDDATTSPRHNAFDDFNSDLKLQVEAGRTLIAALRKQICDEQERVAVLEKQLAREKEQVPLCVSLVILRFIDS
jgi:hypothetical protein